MERAGGLWEAEHFWSACKAQLAPRAWQGLGTGCRIPGKSPDSQAPPCPLCLQVPPGTGWWGDQGPTGRGMYSAVGRVAWRVSFLLPRHGTGFVCKVSVCRVSSLPPRRQAQVNAGRSQHPDPARPRQAPLPGRAQIQADRQQGEHQHPEQGVSLPSVRDLRELGDPAQTGDDARPGMCLSPGNAGAPGTGVQTPLHRHQGLGGWVPDGPLREGDGHPPWNRATRCRGSALAVPAPGDPAVFLSQHMSSRRHKDRLAGKPPKPKYSPYNKLQKNAALAVSILKVSVSLQITHPVCSLKRRLPC